MSTEGKSNFSGALQPIALALALAGGIFLGSRLSTGETLLSTSTHSEGNPNKLVRIINHIDEHYVDSIKREEMVDNAISSILEDLDPHSYYISSDEWKASQEPLRGNFEGIGVEFMITDDTLSVVTPIEGGPSAKAGIRPGDKIVRVDGENIGGIGLTNTKVMELLKGEKGSEVVLGIQRGFEEDLYEYTIARDRIPIHSVVADFMVDDATGYVKVTRFAQTTFDEFEAAMMRVGQAGAKRVVVDLRSNGGGYLNVAKKMIELFLEKNDLIVYTEGLHSPIKRLNASRDGRFRDMDLAILINEGSASASEIMAGAMQDHDRALIVGRRSFGKGLVQEEIDLRDESALRLTVARYYTPTGRSIQKPYGDGIDYAEDYEQRYERGEMHSADSIAFPDSLKFTTPAGRTVYGGGGIMPDIFIPIDTVGGSYYLNELAYSGIFRQFGFDYGQANEADKGKYRSAKEFARNFSPSNLDRLVAEFALEKEGIEIDEEGLAASKEEIENRAMAYIAKQWYGDNAFYYVLLELDNEFQKAFEVLSDEREYAEVMGPLKGAL